MSWMAKQPAFSKARQMDVSTRYGNKQEAAIIIDDGGQVDDDDRG
jgi:hypothetical protein